MFSDLVNGVGISGLLVCAAAVPFYFLAKFPVFRYRLMVAFFLFNLCAALWFSAVFNLPSVIANLIQGVFVASFFSSEIYYFAPWILVSLVFLALAYRSRSVVASLGKGGLVETAASSSKPLSLSNTLSNSKSELKPEKTPVVYTGYTTPPFRAEVDDLTVLPQSVLVADSDEYVLIPVKRAVVHDALFLSKKDSVPNPSTVAPVAPNASAEKETPKVEVPTPIPETTVKENVPIPSKTVRPAKKDAAHWAKWRVE